MHKSFPYRTGQTSAYGYNRFSFDMVNATNYIKFRPGGIKKYMFFFIGGVQPRKIELDENPRMCPVCGLATARLKRIDHYISLFFIPLIPVKRGTPFLECNRCKGVFDETGRPRYGGDFHAVRRCSSCGKELEGDFAYCPYCGKRV